MGRGRERRGEEGSRGEGKGKFVPTNVRDTLTPLVAHVTEAIGVRPTARPAERPGSVVPRSRSRSGSPYGAMRSPRLRRPPDGAIPVPSVHFAYTVTIAPTAYVTFTDDVTVLRVR